MIKFSADLDDLEKTSRLPTLTVEMQLDEALRRERAARIEIVELMRQNLQQANEIEHLQDTQMIERHAATEEKLFEVCGALKETLGKVLKECRTRRLSLNCGSAARRAFEDSCSKLEQILSAPGFSQADIALEPPLKKASQAAARAVRSISVSVLPGKRHASAGERRALSIPHLEGSGTEARSS